MVKSWNIFDTSWNICQDLYRSVQIRTETFSKLQLGGVFLLFKNCIYDKVFFDESWNIHQDLYRSVQIRR